MSGLMKEIMDCKHDNEAVWIYLRGLLLCNGNNINGGIELLQEAAAMG